MATIHLGFLEKAIKGGANVAFKGMAKKEMADMRKSVKEIQDPVERQKQMESLKVAEKIMDFHLKYSISPKLCCLIGAGSDVNVDTVTQICHNWADGLLHENVSEVFCTMFFNENYLAVREELDSETLDILRKAENTFLTSEYVTQWYANFRDIKY
ncbi:MAG: hypothetical protein J1E01_05145 [Acetatifactor sp.]|nr:hypothetical protein [Acetatifactor sp.]